jgi:hypothetical protein
VRTFAHVAPTLVSLEINVSVQAFHPPNSSLPCLGFFMESFLEANLDFAINAFKVKQYFKKNEFIYPFNSFLRHGI